jgi:hypothetical protein
LLGPSSTDAHHEFIDKLTRVVGAGHVGVGMTMSDDWLGWDPTTHIVAVDADTSGRARVWRRVGERVEPTEQRFPNWFLATSLDLLAHLPAQHVDAEWLRARQGRVLVGQPLTVVTLDPPPADVEDAYRYLVLTTNLEDVETALVETANKRDGGEAQSLADLRGLVLIWHPTEQYLALTGRTYFKGMSFGELRRFQFDLETTGLDEDRDRIFMISMRDSSGWRLTLEAATLSEAEVLEQFVQAVQQRDPDVLENHNIFGFDLSFLVKRSARLGVRLALGRDRSEPQLETDVFDSGERPEPFLRWRVAGREVVDTQHAVRRFGAGAPDMRRHGLKDAARYFGFARDDREYVPGAEIWTTYHSDPERIRRYAADDVDEVDGLARRLLPSTFGLATMLPRSYERLAADAGAGSLWELLMVRAYLHGGRAIGAPAPRLQRPAEIAHSDLFLTGVVGPALRAVVHPLLPSVLADHSLAAANDDMHVMPRLAKRLLDDADTTGAVQMLLDAAYPYLASSGLFGDAAAATEAMGVARHYIEGTIADVRSRGCTVIQVLQGEEVVFQVPPDWNAHVEQDVAEKAPSYLPPRVSLAFATRYEALYARAPGTFITLGEDGTVTLVGPAFRSGRLERYGEAFIQRAAFCVLRGDIVGLRDVFLETVYLLRTAQVPLEDLCLQVTLHKSPVQYRRGGTHEEPYEVLLSAGVRSWRVGQRIRYFRGRDGELRLLQESDELTSASADREYYVQRLAALYCQQFAQGFRREDFARIFRMPSGDGPFSKSGSDLVHIHTIATALD